ncbi:XRE family transcriptional regulator [Roseomonas sp. SSH11]|uniref:XRE family transcriptional regulator n=2 Tax=Pararoseomonas baculiformis TaxID=2820812 RepID=A0ABS4AL34_9PROT|nr:XRE family transcriptional regulator [Pararoseomonas baculiformis]MBP0447748.1 XRE family transcriptional regulator [Pararoseomonas baculiformis]
MAGASYHTVRDFERQARRTLPRTINAMRAALETAGIEFIADNDGRPGVRRRQAGA